MKFLLSETEDNAELASTFAVSSVETNMIDRNFEDRNPLELWSCPMNNKVIDPS